MDTERASAQSESIKSELTLKQRLFAHHYTDPEGPGFSNATKSAELAGYKGKPGGNQLAVQGHENLRNPNIRRALEDILDGAGCTLEHAAQRLKEGMDATQSRAFLGKAGKVVYSKSRPDHRERRQATELMFRLRGLLQMSWRQEQMRYLEFGLRETSLPDESGELAAQTKELEQLSPVDRNLLREATEKMVLIARLTRELVYEEKCGKPREELDKEVDEEARKRIRAIFKEAQVKADQIRRPDCGEKKTQVPGSE